MKIFFSKGFSYVRNEDLKYSCSVISKKKEESQSIIEKINHFYNNLAINRSRLNQRTTAIHINGHCCATHSIPYNHPFSISSFSSPFFNQESSIKVKEVKPCREISMASIISHYEDYSVSFAHDRNHIYSLALITIR